MRTLLLLAVALGLTHLCAAQSAVNVASATPETVAVTNTMAPEAPSHRFFDRTNVALTMMTFSAAMADGITTQHALTRHRMTTMTVNGVATQYNVSYTEQDPIAAPLVNRGWPGQIAATALTTAADLGICHWLHSRGHHRMERVVPFLFAATSAGFAAHNAKYW